MNDLKVKSIDENAIIKRIKKLEDKEIIEYFNALQRSCESWRDIAYK